MADKRCDSEQPIKTEGPVAANGFNPASPSQCDESGFVKHPALSGIRSRSMIRKLGPRDYCGFEMDPLGQFDALGFEGALNPSRGRAGGERIHEDLGHGSRERANGNSTESRSAVGATVQIEREDQGDRVVSEPRGDMGTPDRPRAGLSSRPGPPEVPGYAILEELGRGGMGVVYKARQLRLNRVVGLKMILAGDYAGQDAVERIIAEAEMVARLQHPNIVQIHAIGDCAGRPYIELEYVPGGAWRRVSMEHRGRPARRRG